MSQFRFPGARWWKFDFHTHTPASDDFLKGCSQSVKDQVTPEFWLRKFMEKGIECVAVTDHNSGGWIDKLQQKYEELEVNKEELDWFRPLYLFPGVEISAYGDVHILAILGPGKNKGDIDQLLGAVGYQSTKGKSDGVTTKSITELVNAIAGLDGIAIPAHVDQPKGLFEQTQSQIPTLTQVLNNPNILAMELCDENYQKPQEYLKKDSPWTEVRGSDTHNFRHDAFGNFTWIKMDSPPSIEGLRLALIDGTASVNRDMNASPNHHANFLIEELIIDQAKYVGRSCPLGCRFSPFLNTIIGGRGSGKSTLLEFMRLALRREKDLPGELTQENDKYFNVGNQNLLIENSRLSLIYRKHNVRYRLNWSAGADLPSMEEETDGNWQTVPGEIRSLFPAYVYSQKQIFELAKEPSALLDIVDEAPDVDSATFEKQRRELVNRYKQIEQKIQELSDNIESENRLRGERNDLARQIEQIEKSGHREVLQNYRKRQQQRNEISNVEANWQGMSDQIKELGDSVAPVQFNTNYFDGYDEMLSALRAANEKWVALNDKLSGLAQEAQTFLSNWQVEKKHASWLLSLEAEMDRYDQLRTQLEQQDIDPNRYPSLLTQQRNLQRELQQIGAYRSRIGELEVEKRTVFENIVKNRKALTERRKAFLDSVLKDNSSVSIEVLPFGQDWAGIEKEVRSILQCPERYARDFQDLKHAYESSCEQKIEGLKGTIERIRNGERGNWTGWFVKRVQGLPQESISDVNLWFPEDDLKITFGAQNHPIEQGSPGQKTAALLAFILSYGSEPLLLDQPEDDLDNELIYDLIVQQLRETKRRRQIIVVTHNANIVVNGDAEMVLPLEVTKGETHLRRAASIQDKQVRQTICDVLEGGQLAFEQRYRRIHLEN